MPVQQGPGMPLLGQPYKEATQFSLLQSSGSPTKSVPGTPSGLTEVMRDPTKHADMHHIIRQFTLVAKVAYTLYFYACLLCVRLARPVAMVHRETPSMLRNRTCVPCGKATFLCYRQGLAEKDKKGQHRTEGLAEPQLGTTALEKTNTAL